MLLGTLNNLLDHLVSYPLRERHVRRSKNFLELVERIFVYNNGDAFSCLSIIHTSVVYHTDEFLSMGISPKAI